jgi:voltage-gated potassium channel Kch
MATIQYTYSIQSDFPNHKVASDRLVREIQASAIVTALGWIDTDGDACYIWFKDELSVGDKTLLDGLVAAHAGEPLPNPALPVSIEGVVPTSQNRLPTVAARPVAPKVTFVTPNWCDKTTWYGDAVAVVDEVAIDGGDHKTYVVLHQNLIDTYHGKITFEDTLKDANGISFRVAVKVDGAVKVEQDPQLAAPNGDFVVDYAAGAVVFHSAQVPSAVVEVTYHYARSSLFVIAPVAGKRLYVGTVEVQFSEDLEMLDSFVFQAYGYVDVFAPQLMLPPTSLPSGTKIPLGDPLTYKTMTDFLNDSNSSYPAYPAFGGTNWRALKKQAYLFVWDYLVGMTCLEARYGMELRVFLQHEIPCVGEFGTATFYCTSESEV